MVIEVPEQIEARLTPEAVALNLALGLYTSREVTIGQAAGIAKISIPAFQDELGRRKIPINYGLADLETDLRTIQKLHGV
jgi:predicted HTH domain antitoxin